MPRSEKRSEVGICGNSMAAVSGLFLLLTKLEPALRFLLLSLPAVRLALRGAQLTIQLQGLLGARAHAAAGFPGGLALAALGVHCHGLRGASSTAGE